MNPATRCNVLLVDDEVDYLRTLAKRLKRRGMNVHAVHSGEEALLHLEGNEADVVVLDLKMRGMDGIETLKEIKSRHPLVEVIMLTGHASGKAAIEGMGLGAFDYLMKPVEFDEFLYRIQDAHERKSLDETKNRTHGSRAVRSDGEGR